jgi:hypothetical protein
MYKKYDIKLPAFVWRALFFEKMILMNHPIEPADRSSFVGEKTDCEGISKRYIVPQDQSIYLKAVLEQTNNAIMKLVGVSSWGKVLREDGIKFYKEI